MLRKDGQLTYTAIRKRRPRPRAAAAAAAARRRDRVAQCSTASAAPFRPHPAGWLEIRAEPIRTDRQRPAPWNRSAGWSRTLGRRAHGDARGPGQCQDLPRPLPCSVPFTRPAHPPPHASFTDWQGQPWSCWRRTSRPRRCSISRRTASPTSASSSLRPGDLAHLARHHLPLAGPSAPDPRLEPSASRSKQPTALASTSRSSDELGRLIKRSFDQERELRAIRN